MSYKVLLSALAVISVCSAAPKDGKIVGGDLIQIQKVPYQVSLQYNGQHICGGSIVNNITIVTAAHCVSEFEANSLSIRAGSSLHSSGGVTKNVSKVFIHPQYNAELMDYDIAVLKLDTPLITSESIKSIALPEPNIKYPTGSLAYVSGWGLLTESSQTLTAELRGVVVPTIDRSICNKIYNGILSPRMLCAGYSIGGKDSCQGDSGGGLQIKGVLSGIVSFGQGCARIRIPGIYTSVSSVVSFIKSNLK
ncbi:unnamed protein product [Diamesa tonsa]